MHLVPILDIRSVPKAAMRTAALVAALTLLPIATALSGAETTEDAIQRIRAGQHVAMPPPTSTAASGPAGKGMTIENESGHTLHVHFSGPVTRTVVVPNGQAAGVELAVGRYQVAAEIPQSRIVPFYGEQAYEPNTHYWLKFFVRQRSR